MTIASIRSNNLKVIGAAKATEHLLIASLFLFVLFAPHSIAVAQISWMLGMLFWVLRFTFFPRPELQRTPIDYAMFGFFVWTGISSFLSYEPMVSIGKLRAASLFTIVYLFAQNIPNRRVLRMLTLALVASCFVNVLFTVGQRIVGRGVKVQNLKTESPLYAGGVRPGDTLLELDGRKVSDIEELANGLSASHDPKSLALLKIYRQELVPIFKIERGKLLSANNAAGQLGIENWTRGRDWRASGFFGHYVTYAEMLQMIVALAVGLFVSLPKKTSVIGLLLMIGMAGFCYALMLTVTRASWLAFLISTAVIVLVGTSRKTILIIGMIAIPVVIGGLFVLQQKRNVRFLDQRDQSTTWRQTVWKEGTALLISKPRHLVFGVGMDSIKSHWREWGLFEGGKIPRGHMHSNLLQLALERGIPGLLLWLVMFGLYIRALLQLKRRVPADETSSSNDVFGRWVDRGLVLAALGGTVGFFVSGVVHYNWGDSEVVMIFYLIMGLTLALHRLESAKSKVQSRKSKVAGSDAV